MEKEYNEEYNNIKQQLKELLEIKKSIEEYPEKSFATDIHYQSILIEENELRKELERMSEQ